jgi:glycosyltransferase involved in cell wall biosynthesis
VASTKRLAVVIPSRTQPAQARFLNNAIGSLRAQVSIPDIEIEIIIALDEGSPTPVLNHNNLCFVMSRSRGQAAALNLGATDVDADYIAFLEDDDRWLPERAALGLQALKHADFTSTTQLEVDETGTVVRINDFATPSGWLMPLSSWLRIGPFDESFRWHLDTEWLGRLGDSGLRRIHLVESTAPVVFKHISAVRPWLEKCLRHGGANVALGRHNLPVPLVTRLVHSNSGMATIASNAAAKAASKAEYERLFAKFGRWPW